MTSADPASPSLSELNQLIHDRLDEAVIDALERALALDLEAALLAWQRVEGALAAHAAAEDALVLPLIERYGPAPRGASRVIMDKEHGQLVRLFSDAGARLGALLPGPDLRRRLVIALDTLLRPRNLLQHHTTREQRIVYPFLQQRLSALELASVAAELQASLREVSEILTR